MKRERCTFNKRFDPRHEAQYCSHLVGVKLWACVLSTSMKSLLHQNLKARTNHCSLTTAPERQWLQKLATPIKNERGFNGSSGSLLDGSNGKPRTLAEVFMADSPPWTPTPPRLCKRSDCEPFGDETPQVPKRICVGTDADDQEAAQFWQDAIEEDEMREVLA